MGDNSKPLTARLVCLYCKAEADLHGTPSEIARRLLTGIPCGTCGSLSTAVMAPKTKEGEEVCSKCNGDGWVPMPSLGELVACDCEAGKLWAVGKEKG